MTEWLYNYKQNEVKPSTFDRIEQVCKNQIFPYIGDFQMNSITANDFQNMINKLSLKYSYSTVKKAYDYTKSCFTLAYDKREILNNPFVRISLPTNKKKEISDIYYYNDDEIELIKRFSLEKYSNGKYIYKYGYAIILLLYTGMRIIPLSAMALEALNYFKIINRDHIYIVSSDVNRPLSPRNLDRTFRSILTNAGITNIHGVHSLRHTFASMLFRKGVDVKTVSELLGHSDTGVTYNIYIHLIQEQKVKAIESLDDL